MEYICRKLTSEEVFALLEKAENSFTPPLSHNIPYSVHEYADRLSNNAMFVLGMDNEEVVGFIAFYSNEEGMFAYIPQIWVSDNHQRQGIGSSMIDRLVKSLPNDFQSIRLEVRKNNEKAFRFYVKTGYEIIEEKNGKLLMEKMIERV